MLDAGERTDANARLIVSAPALLAERDRLKAALQVLRAAISDFVGHGMPGFTDRAEALLSIREADAALAEGGKI